MPTNDVVLVPLTLRQVELASRGLGLVAKEQLEASRDAEDPELDDLVDALNARDEMEALITEVEAQHQALGA